MLFKGNVIGDTREKCLNDIVCGEHCDVRFLDEVVCQPDTRQRFRVVKQHRIAPPRRPVFTPPEDEF